MQHPTSRPRRVRRVIAISAAAVAVMIAPTACDYGGPAQMDMTGHSGHMDGMNMDAPVQEHQVVQVGSTRSSTPTTDEAAAATASTAEAQRVASERRRGDDGRRGEDGRGRGRGNQTTTATTAPTGATSTTTTAPTTATSATSTAATSGTATSTAPPAAGPNNGLDVLGQRCADSQLPAHTGFQSADAQCVDIAMGEIAPEDQLPSLLITGAPRFVRVGEKFQLKVSTRNLVRDRFLGAAAGGYYLESSFLNADKLQRGHFHTACRSLSSTRSAPDSGKAPEFFLATQDNGGGAKPDTVTIDVPGIKTAGVLQCTSWAGDGSHRTPMMSRANETPAIDSVRIFVVGRGQRVDNAAAADAALAPAAAGAADVADASADEAKQVQAEEQAAATQKPDGGVAAIPAPADAAAVPADPATSAAAPAESAAPPAG
ncbi:hypothetical protein [Pseudonocardia charpentierae]|uniref:Uncharacterized protein n=1 Tax=Pseudonocardia charpentierae TaxID=3075545 RepID=A0ABU2N2Q6_9PSEU|nr:hypothetical protein [Pseudonocardia sp. DSM 45834]MDT0348198.1 hypothetical protein [Pseudonocardia sp. DSM 45834]